MANQSQQQISLNDFENLPDHDNQSDGSYDSDEVFQKMDEVLSQSQQAQQRRDLEKQLGLLPKQNSQQKNNILDEQLVERQNNKIPVVAIEKEIINQADQQNHHSFNPKLQQVLLKEELSPINLVQEPSHRKFFISNESPLSKPRNLNDSISKQLDIGNFVMMMKDNNSKVDQATQTPTKSDFKETFEEIKRKNQSRSQSPGLLSGFMMDLKLPAQRQDHSPKFNEKPHFTAISFLDKNSLEHFIQDLKQYQKSQRMLIKTQRIGRTFDVSPRQNLKRSSVKKKKSLTPQKERGHWNDIIKRLDSTQKERVRDNILSKTVKVQSITEYEDPIYKALYEQSDRFLRFK